jgi:hypothetical protein
MKLGTVVLLMALVTAPACGGGGGDSTAAGGSPTPIAAAFTPDQGSPGPNTVALIEGSKSNDVVTVNVTVTGTNDVFGAAFEVLYDDFHTTFLGYTPGTVVEQGGNAPTYNVDGSSNPGRIVIGISRTGSSSTDVTSTKTLVGLQFRVKQAGVYQVVIQNAAVYDNQDPPQPIPTIAWFAGAVTGV